jgi:hypothetical protein
MCPAADAGSVVPLAGRAGRRGAMTELCGDLSCVVICPAEEVIAR